MSPSLYERLARRAWSLGRYGLDPGEPSGEAPAEERPGRLRAEMERIAAVEAERAVKEGGMKLAKFVKFREEKFGGVLFETRQEKVYTLNPTAAAVVRLVADGEADPMGRLKSKFQDPDGRLEADARELLADLKAKGLITQ